MNPSVPGSENNTPVLVITKLLPELLTLTDESQSSEIGHPIHPGTTDCLPFSLSVNSLFVLMKANIIIILLRYHS